MKKGPLVLVAFLLAASVCWYLLTRVAPSPSSPSYESEQITTPDPERPAPAREIADRNLPAPGPDRVALASDGNAFALDMYGRLRGADGNLFFSPYSVSSALAMAYSGARAKTAEEMRATLRLSLPDERLYAAFAGQMKEANDPAKPFDLSIANSLWGQSGLPYKKDFLGLAERTFGAALSPVDFSGAPAAACEKINAWVSEKTRGRIKEIVSPRMISRAVRLILVNAIYFKGSWERRFDKDFTQDQPFYASKTATSSVLLMRQTEDFGYADDGRAQVLSMPYRGKELSMVAVLPRDKTGLKDLEDRLSKKQVDDWLGSLRPAKVEVWFPKFKLETTYDLADDLKAMGMSLAFARFDPKEPQKPHADFTGVLDPGAGRLNIDFVIHKAFVDVNEEGTEAAAATAIGMVGAAAVHQPVEVPVFRADHPFLFLIREERTGAILFMGRFSKPG